MGKWLKKGLEGIVVMTLLTSCARGLSTTPVPREYNLQKIEETAVPTTTSTPEPTIIPRLPQEDWIEMYNFDSNFFEEYDELQIQTFMDMNSNQISDLGHLVEVKDDIFDYNFPPGYLLALSNSISPFESDLEAQKKIANYAIDMIDSNAYILTLSDNLTPYFGALAWDQLEEDFGLNVIKIFDNSEKGTPQYDTNIVEYTDEIDRMFTIGSTVEDRVEAIENQEPIIARNYGLDRVLRTIIDAEEGNEGPITLYYVQHMHFIESVVLYDNINTRNYTAEEMFPEYFLKRLEGRHLNIILNTCPVEFISGTEEIVGLKEQLDKFDVSYTLLYGDHKGNPYQGFPSQGFPKSIEIIVNSKFLGPNGPEYPAVTFNDFVDVAEGDLEGAIVEKQGDFLFYTIRPFENYNGVSGETLDHFELWPAEIKIYLRVEPGSHELNYENYDFEVSIASSDNYENVKEFLPLFGLGLIE